jgi:hypothetical protein
MREALTDYQQAPPLLSSCGPGFTNGLSQFLLGFVDVLRDFLSALIDVLNHGFLFSHQLLHLVK